MTKLLTVKVSRPKSIFTYQGKPGPKGDKGDPGLDGVNTVPADNAIADYITNPSATQTALTATIESQVTPSGERVFYVSRGAKGNDTNDGLSWSAPFATVDAAATALIVAGGGVLQLGYGTYATNGIIRPNSAVIRGVGMQLTTILLNSGKNVNVIEDAALGDLNDVGIGGAIESLTIDGNKANQTLLRAESKTTTTITLTTGSPINVYVRNATQFSDAGYTGADPDPRRRTLWIGDTRCTFTSLANLGTFDPSSPTTTGWVFGGVQPANAGVSRTYYSEALILPGKPWGCGIASQSAYLHIADVLVRDTKGSGYYIQGTGSPTGISAVESAWTHPRSQRADGWAFEIGPDATDGRTWGAVTGNGKLGGILSMGENWKWTDVDINGVFLTNHNAQDAPYGIVLCAGHQFFNNAHFGVMPFSNLQINLAWKQTMIDTIQIDGDSYQSSWAGSGAGVAVALYGQQDNQALSIRGLSIKMGCRSRLLRAMTIQPTTETTLVTGTTFTTPANSDVGVNLQVLSAHPFSPLGSAIAGTLQVGTTLDTVSYTGRTTTTHWVATAATSGATSLTLDATTGLDPTGMVNIYPQSTSAGSAAPNTITYTGITGNTLTGIPATGNGSLPESIPPGAGVTQHYLTGVKSTGVGGVLIPDGTTVVQAGGVTGRRVNGVSGDVRADVYQNRRMGSPIYPMNQVGPKLRLSGWVLDNPNPFYGSATIPVGASSVSVAHGLSAAPTVYSATQSTGAPQGVKVQVDATNITVSVASAVTGTAVTCQISAQNTPN